MKTDVEVAIGLRAGLALAEARVVRTGLSQLAALSDDLPEGVEEKLIALYASHGLVAKVRRSNSICTLSLAKAGGR